MLLFEAEELVVKRRCGWVLKSRAGMIDDDEDATRSEWRQVVVRAEAEAATAAAAAATVAR